MHELSACLHACLVGGSPVILNAQTGRYILVRGETGHALSAFLLGNLSPSVVDTLLAARLIISAPDNCRIAPKPPVATFSYAEGYRWQDGWHLLPPALFLMLRAAILLRGRAIGAVLQSQFTVRHPRATTGKNAFLSERQIAAAFHRIQRIIPSSNHCVARSVALCWLLLWCGHRSFFIVGVQLPIAAHCWVQCEERVIGDTLERIHPFEPIVAA
jgi:hypothetical protein